MRSASATVLRRTSSGCHKQNEQIRKLCYQQYTWCERTGRAGDAKLYNELLAAWHAIESAALEHGAVDEQPTLF